MTSPTTTAEGFDQARLRILAGIADRSIGDVWQVEHDDGGMHVVAQRAKGERAILCTIHPQASPDEAELIGAALETLIFFFRLRRQSIATLRALQQQPASQRQNLRAGNFSAQAAIMCADPEFHRFIEKRDGSNVRAIHTEEAADLSMKRVLGITSKRQLNSEEAAQKAFFKLRNEFDAWKGQGQGRR